MKITTKKTHLIFKMDHILYNFHTRIREEETIDPWTVSGILLSIHSPFVPVNPFDDALVLQNSVSRKKCIFSNLLIKPTARITMAYGKKNNKTGPRSQEMCKEWCLWNFSTTCVECYRGFTMIENSKLLCETKEPCRGNIGILIRCMKNCKPNC
ncbi:hypothetical protein NPIL_567511, partial [Nephila pilipes]